MILRRTFLKATGAAATVLPCADPLNIRGSYDVKSRVS
jgi:hypothetical protein